MKPSFFFKKNALAFNYVLIFTYGCISGPDISLCDDIIVKNIEKKTPDTIDPIS